MNDECGQDYFLALMGYFSTLSLKLNGFSALTVAPIGA